MAEIKTPEVNEIKKPVPENFKNIQPENGMTGEKAKGFWDNVFDKMGDVAETVKDRLDGKEFGPQYNTMKHMVDRTPSMDSEKGVWTGERGNSKFIPNDNTEAGKAAKEKLAEYGQDGILFKDGEPDFSKCAEASVKIENMTENRASNFNQADEACKKLWNEMGKDGRTDWTAREVKKWRDENNCTWHERCDTKSMDLVSKDIHNTEAQIFTHSGGCSECKMRDAQNKMEIGDEFDE